MRAPALPIAPETYSKGHLDVLLRVLTQYFTANAIETDYRANRSLPAQVSASTQMGDDEHSFVALVSGLTMTLPPASSDRYGRDWTVSLGVAGWTDITVSAGDSLILPGVDDTIRLDIKGSSVTLRCMSGNSWGIV